MTINNIDNVQQLVDNTTTAGYVYVCSANPWTATSAPYWKIIKVDTLTWSTLFPKVSWVINTHYEHIADNRASLTYSYN
jgi:hypothetical protein